MKVQKQKINFFSDGFKIFLSHISRQLKKNPDYKPHPLIRAFECAITDVEKMKDSERAIGISQDGTDNDILNSFIVVIEKHKRGIEVKEIHCPKVNKTLPVDVMIYIFRIQIKLDKIAADTVTPEQMVEVLNSVVPGNKFFALGDRWEEARNIFRELMDNRKIHIPPDQEFINELKSLRWDAPWEDYSNRLRSFIGSCAAPHLANCKGVYIITSPTNSKIEKARIFDIVTELFLGQSAEYLNPLK